MTKKLLPIFATQSDLLMVIREVKLERQLDLVDSGLFDAPPSLIKDVESLLPLRTYLAFDEGLSINIKKVSEHGGGVRYAVQTEDLPAVAIHYGGMLEEKRLIAGQIAAVGDEKAAGEIYELFKKNTPKI